MSYIWNNLLQITVLHFEHLQTWPNLQGFMSDWRWLKRWWDVTGWSCTYVRVPLCFSLYEAAIHAWPKVLCVTVFAPHLAPRISLLHCMAYPLRQTLSWLFRSSGWCLAGILDQLVASCCCLSGKPSSPAPLFSRSPSLSAPPEWRRTLYWTWPLHLHVSMWGKKNKSKIKANHTLTQTSTTNSRESLDCSSTKCCSATWFFSKLNLVELADRGVP